MRQRGALRRADDGAAARGAARCRRPVSPSVAAPIAGPIRPQRPGFFFAVVLVVGVEVDEVDMLGLEPGSWAMVRVRE